MSGRRRGGETGMLGRVRRLVPLACLAVACTLRGDGVRADETRELPVFTTLEVFDGFAATITVDPSSPAQGPVAVTVSGDANALQRLFTVWHGEGALSVAIDPNRLTSLSLSPTLEATVPGLGRAYAADTTVLEILGAAGELSLEVREWATLAVTGASAASVTAEAHENATLILAGEGPTLTLTVEDAATVDARDFRAIRVTVEAHGTGQIEVCAVGLLTVRGPGASRVLRVCG